MAKKVKATIDVSGYSVKQIMDLEIDINKLGRNDLARVTGRLVSASNKRIRSLAKTEIGQLSPAYRSRMERGGLFSTKGLNTNQLRHLFGEAKGYLQLKTSSVKGWKKIREDVVSDMEKGIEENTGTKVDLSELLSTTTKSHKFWKTFREIEEMNNIPDKNTKSKYNSERIKEMVAEMYDRKSGHGGFRQSREDVVDAINEKITQLYEQEKEEQNKFSRTADMIGDEDDDDENGDFDGNI